MFCKNVRISDFVVVASELVSVRNVVDVLITTVHRHFHLRVHWRVCFKANHSMVIVCVELVICGMERVVVHWNVFFIGGIVLGWFF